MPTRSSGTPVRGPKGPTPARTPGTPRFESAGRLRLSVQHVATVAPCPSVAPVFACPTRSGDMAACVIDPQRGDARIWRFDADGQPRLHLTLPPRAPGWQVAGFTWLGSEGFALAHARSDAAAAEPGAQSLIVQGHASDGSLRWVLDDPLRAPTGPDDRAAPSAARGLHRPWPGTPVRMAYGHGHLCLHLAHLARWPDGSLVQGGFARSLRLPSSRGDRAPDAGPLAGLRPWFGSRSLDQRCSFDPHRDNFVLASLSDAFPRAVLVSRLGGGSWRDQVLQWLPGEPGASEVAAELGGLVPLRESLAVSFTSTVAAQPESRDVFVGFVLPDLRATPLVVKVTSHLPGTYAVAPKLAAMGRHLLVAWTCLSPATGEAEPMVAVVTPQAQLLIGPQALRGLVLDTASDWFTDVHGAVNWFALQPDGLHWLRMRFARGPWRLAATHDTATDTRRHGADHATADDDRGGRRP